MSSSQRLIVVAAALGLLASACVVRTYDVEYHRVVTTERPPEPRQEEPPAAPSEAYVWVPGYWYWGGARYLWVSGRWASPPAPGHVWVRSGWVVVDGRYRYIPGRWAGPARVPAHRYVHPRRVIRRR